MAGERKNKPKSAVDQDMIRELARLLDETGLTEIEFERDGQRVRVARQAQVMAARFQLWECSDDEPDYYFNASDHSSFDIGACTNSTADH